jgi:hypothetical protein
MDEPLRVEVGRSGGFAGVTTRASAAADELDEAQAAELVALAGSCGPALDVARPAVAAPGADRFTYEITIVSGDTVRSSVVGEADLTPECRQLVRWILRSGRGPSPSGGPAS